MSVQDPTTQRRLKKLKNKVTPEFIEYCSDRGINPIEWYKWQLHLIWQHRKLSKEIHERTRNVQGNLSSWQRIG